MDCLETAQLEVEALTDVGVGWTELKTLLDQIEIVLIETSDLKLFMVANLRYQLSVDNTELPNWYRLSYVRKWENNDRIVITC